MKIARHNWSESDEKSLVSTAEWVEEHIDKAAMKDRGGKWKLVSGMLFTDRGLRVTGNACRKRFADIQSRLSVTKAGNQEVVSLLGVDFPQAVEKTEEDKLKERVAVLERQVKNLIHSLNQFGEIRDEVVKIANAVNQNTIAVGRQRLRPAPRV